MIQRASNLPARTRTSESVEARRGFTLVEMLLVLALILLVAAIAVPSLDAWFQSYRVQEAADDLQTALIKARTRAMEEGRPYRFEWGVLNERFYRLAPDDAVHWAELQDSPVPPSLSGFDDPPGLTIETELPEGVRFVGGLDTVIFQPDGTAKIYSNQGDQFVLVILEDWRGRRRILQIRGLTGGVTVVINPQGNP